MPSFYNLAYDTFGNRTTTSVGTQLLSQNIYRQGDGKLTGMAYGNGSHTAYDYDTLGRVSKTTSLAAENSDGMKNGYVVENKYNAFGALSQTTVFDAVGVNEEVYTTEELTKSYSYDTIGRQISYSGVRGVEEGTKTISAFYGYDSCSRLNKTSYSYGTTAAYNQNYTYE